MRWLDKLLQTATGFACTAADLDPYNLLDEDDPDALPDPVIPPADWITTWPAHVLARPTPPVVGRDYTLPRCPLCQAILKPGVTPCPWCTLTLDWAAHTRAVRTLLYSIERDATALLRYRMPIGVDEVYEAVREAVDDASERRVLDLDEDDRDRLITTLCDWARSHNE